MVAVVCSPGFSLLSLVSSSKVPLVLPMGTVVVVELTPFPSAAPTVAFSLFEKIFTITFLGAGRSSVTVPVTLSFFAPLAGFGARVNGFTGIGFTVPRSMA